jgi:hypothetical protein
MARLRNEQQQALKNNIEEEHARLTLNFLKSLVAAAKPQIDLVTWREKGGLEGEQFLDSLEHGYHHPALQKWQRLKAANHPAPTNYELHVRSLVAALCSCLERIGLSKRQAHRLAAEKLKLLVPGITKNSVDHWERNNLSQPWAERVIQTALNRAKTPDEIVRYFIGLIRFRTDPFTRVIRDNDDVIIVPRAPTV